MSRAHPFLGIGMVGGIRIIESPDRPRYVLPEELITGVPWPPGFRDEINAWSLSFLGTVNLIKAGTLLILPGNIAMMRPEDVASIMSIGS